MHEVSCNRRVASSATVVFSTVCTECSWYLGRVNRLRFGSGCGVLNSSEWDGGVEEGEVEEDG